MGAGKGEKFLHTELSHGCQCVFSAVPRDRGSVLCHVFAFSDSITNAECGDGRDTPGLSHGSGYGMRMGSRWRRVTLRGLGSHRIGEDDRFAPSSI